MSAGPGAARPGRGAAAMRRALQHGPRRPASAGCGGAAAPGEGDGDGSGATRPPAERGGGRGAWGAARLGSTSGGAGGEGRSAPGPGMEPGAGRPWRGRLVLGSPSPVAGPAREHRRRGSLPSQPSSVCLRLRGAFPFLPSSPDKENRANFTSSRENNWLLMPPQEGNGYMCVRD